MPLIKTAIMKTPLYPAARRAYHAVFHPDARVQKARMGAFYSQFFQTGDLMFNIGAAEYVDMFVHRD
jgi:hypothetical protein